jgi:predicted DNA-binding protein with PD1-like motif
MVFMPKNIDSVLIKEPIKKQFLTLQLDEGDNVLSCIKQGMLQNNVRECDVVDVSGSLTTASVQAMEGHRFKKIDFSNTKILRASGHFKITGGDLWGSLHVFTEGRKPISGTLLSGKASHGFELKFSFLP